jgi:enoyl-CoA hydratase
LRFSCSRKGRKLVHVEKLTTSKITTKERKKLSVAVEQEKNGIVWFTICRPEKRNAIDYEVMDRLQETIEMVEKNEAAKVLVITGEGEEAFCSGGDLSVFHRLTTKEEAYSMLSKMGKILYSLLTLSKPTVALINGTAIGGGCELATACDFRYAKKGSRIGFVQANLAITTGWGGATMLFEKMPYDEALHLLLCANMIRAEEAEKRGWIHHCLSSSDIKEECRQLLMPYLGKSSSVLSAYKQAATAKWKAKEFYERFFAEIERCAVLWESPEHDRAVQAFLTK